MLTVTGILAYEFPTTLRLLATSAFHAPRSARSPRTSAAVVSPHRRRHIIALGLALLPEITKIAAHLRVASSATSTATWFTAPPPTPQARSGPDG